MKVPGQHLFAGAVVLTFDRHFSLIPGLRVISKLD